MRLLKRITQRVRPAAPQPLSAFGVGASDVGLVRARNEDRLHVDNVTGLYLVADGMGGHAAGDVAATLAVSTVVEQMRTTSWSTAGEAVDVMQRAFLLASAQVRRYALEAGHPRTGTTLTGVLVVGSSLAFAHVGDSRLYLVRSGALQQLTQDHTVAQALVSRGVITAASVATSQFSHLLTSTIGSHETPTIDSGVIELFEDDHLLLCTDGVSAHLDTVNLAYMADRFSPPACVSELINHANSCGGYDNATAVLVNVQSAGHEPLPRIPSLTEHSHKVDSDRPSVH